jgi:signal transduction histidine kinase
VVLFELYAQLVGAKIRDAQVYGRTEGRLERLDRVNQLQREFLRGVSHNLQTPLTTISLVAQDLARSGQVPAEFRAAQIQAIQSQTSRLEHLVAQLLTISRLDAGRLSLERDALAITPLVRRVWATLGVDRGIEVEERSGDLVPLGDREAIEQILWIVLDNAIRYAPDGPIRVVIVPVDGGAGTHADAADARAAEPRTRIEIHDLGPGVPNAERQHIFRRFWRGAAGRTHHGTGIGLDVARRLARAMGGSLHHEPGTPTGSVFVLTLPAAVAIPA